MAKQVVNTERFSLSVARLRNVNDNINSEFQTLKNKSRKLESSWNGNAAEAAKTTLYRLYGNNDVRSKVIQNYINMLEQQVNPGYTSAEEVNTTLADKFK